MWMLWELKITGKIITQLKQIDVLLLSERKNRYNKDKIRQDIWTKMFLGTKTNVKDIELVTHYWTTLKHWLFFNISLMGSYMRED